jgi:hypothetical protein
MSFESFLEKLLLGTATLFIVILLLFVVGGLIVIASHTLGACS